MTTATGVATDVQVHKSHVRTLVGTGIGNAVEWYDWAIYATFSPFIASALFSKEDPTSAFLATLAIFAVGFVARPFGGFVFGWIGDRVGRKTSMTFAVGLAALGSLLIGIAPSFEAVGAFASVLLLVARLIQGLAHGGELPSSQTYLSEMAPKEKRGFWATLIYTSGTVGILAGTMLGATLSNVLSKTDMNAWGWRIPFIIGGIMGIY
ncbi:MAG: MFS transporter, partial [Actinomycetota bacterium]|nr:MFS transporter [Actinomycetota bacterium]